MRKSGVVLIALGAVLLLAALLLFLYNQHEDAMAGQAAGEAYAAMQDILVQQEPDPNAPSMPDLTQQIPEETQAEGETPTQPTELTIVNIEGNDYICYLSFADYDLNLPIMADWSMDKLQVAPCLQYGSPLTDDAVIAGHNFKHHFRCLHDIEEGAFLSFTDMNGYVIEYQVTQVKIIDPTNVYEVINSEFDLILYTCTSGGQSRVIVCCDRLADQPQAETGETT